MRAAERSQLAKEAEEARAVREDLEKERALASKVGCSPLPPANATALFEL